MPDRCVIYGCSNETNSEKRISLHKIPFPDDDRAEAKKRRKRWTDFISMKRAKWRPTKHSVVCSEHFTADDFQHLFIVEVPNSKASKPRVKRDDFGISVYPTIRVACKDVEPSARSARQISRRLSIKIRSGESSVFLGDSTTCTTPCGPSLQDHDEVVPSQDGSPGLPNSNNEVVEVVTSINDCIPYTTDNTETQNPDTNTTPVKPPCSNCAKLMKRNRQLRNNWMSAKFKLRKCRLRLNSSMRGKNGKSGYSSDSCSEVPTTPLTVEMEDFEDMDIDEDAPNESDYDVTEEEPEDDEDSYIGQTDTDTDTDTDDEIHIDSKVYITDDNIRTEPKFIVFLSQLLLLFKFCYFCKDSNPLVETRQVGTMAEVTAMCTNPMCRKEFVWKSQPVMPSSKIPAGNLLLSYAILVGGGSASKVLQIFKHMGLACMSLATFFKHQQQILFPSILIYWKRYQQRIIDQLKSTTSGIIIAGDGRHDSMGHSAKYCCYTIFSCTSSQIIHFNLVQRNECGSSPAMEYIAFDRSMTYLLGSGLTLSTFISDRHTSIVKHMREKLSQIIHYFDLWHLKKKITKTLTKLSKESGCEVIGTWTQACGNHLYWSACSTHSGNGEVIWAKFSSFLSHVIDQHENLKDPLFNKCQHGPELSPRQWLDEDSVPYDKLCKALKKTSLVNGIKKASPIAQTSCLEGFHSVVNQFAPKMIHYSFSGMYCRNILAILHFNLNLRRDIRLKKDGSQQLKVVYPKFKNGQGTVRDIRIQPKFDYVEEVFQTITEGLKEKSSLHDAMQELKSMTPAPMNTMLEKQPRAEALQDRQERQKILATKDVAPTTPVTTVGPSEINTHTSKAKPHCKDCKNPMKGHKNITDCPRNISSQNNS